MCQPIKIKIAYEDKEQPPYYMLNSTVIPRENPGVAVEMVSMLSQYIPELEIELVRMPWKRCTYSLGENLVDGIFNSSYVKERLEIGFYPTLNKKNEGPVDKERRLAMISYHFYSIEGNGFQWNGDFNEVKLLVGAPSGYSIINDLKNKNSNILIEEAPDSKTNLLKILKGRIAAAALQDVTADDIIKSEPKTFKQIKKHKIPIVEKEYYLMLSKAFVKENPELAQKIWDTIKIIREKESKRLIQKYAKL
jgi:polar amino acid transport system substrate-binding protein